MEVASFCQLLATLSVSPNKLQFFRYDRIQLSCAPKSSNWTVRRNTRTTVNESCGSNWSVHNGPLCTIRHAYPADTGVYWCESQHGGCSNRVNLTVTAGSVVLESPAFVTEGDDAFLRCSTNTKVVFNASFYKDQVFIGTQHNGTLIIRGVAAADQALYKCKGQTGRESPASLLLVRERSGPPLVSGSSPVPLSRIVCGVLLVLVYSVLLVLCIYTYWRWSGAKANTATM